MSMRQADRALAEFQALQGLSEGFAHVARAIFDVAVSTPPERRPTVLGLCGAQGSGKSTAASAVAAMLEAEGRTVALLSLDDLYLTLAERQDLARAVHPLLATRGPPGTHDTALGLTVLERLARPGESALPRFDKGLDDRAPVETWPQVAGPADVVLLEGWCVGARPQAEAALAAPVNALERDEDPDGVWRTYANTALAGLYQALFSRLDRLVLLAAPGFEVVAAWRGEQEVRLRERRAAEGRGEGRTMTDAGLARFTQHYERLTRHILAEMPGRADLVVRLDPRRTPLNLPQV